MRLLVQVAGVLNYMGVEFADVNVLDDDDIRQGIKDFSDWPTIPQLYVKGEFVGGCDIITEMTLSGELDQLFDTERASPTTRTPPRRSAKPTPDPRAGLTFPRAVPDQVRDCACPRHKTRTFRGDSIADTKSPAYPSVPSG